METHIQYGPMGDSGDLTVARKIHVIGEALGGLVGEELMSLADSVLQFEPTPFSTDAEGLADDAAMPGFDLNNFVDAATGLPASEVIGGPGHYYLKPEPEELTMVSDEKPSANELLVKAMTQAHDPTERSVTIPVKKLMEVQVEIGNLERKAQANGQLCMEKTQELVQLRAQLSACEQSREQKVDTISKVWEQVEAWDDPEAVTSPNVSRLRELLLQPRVDAQSVPGQKP